MIFPTPRNNYSDRKQNACADAGIDSKMFLLKVRREHEQAHRP